MKQKKLRKKLCLKKQTISHLNGNEMERIYGGTLWDTVCIGCTTKFACTGDCTETETGP